MTTHRGGRRIGRIELNQHLHVGELLLLLARDVVRACVHVT